MQVCGFFRAIQEFPKLRGKAFNESLWNPSNWQRRTLLHPQAQFLRSSAYNEQRCDSYCCSLFFRGSWSH